MNPAPGHVFWLFGLSGAGKSTLADGLAAAVRADGAPVLTLDGDALRAGLCRGLGFSDADRTENLRRAAEAARLGALSGLCVVASFITPQQVQRLMITEIISRDHLSWIYLDAPLEVCRRRDIKGLYARAEGGQLAQMTGVSSSFEIPAVADLTIPTGSERVAASVDRLLGFVRGRQPAKPVSAIAKHST